MKAIVYHRYGTPDVLELTEVDKPVAKDDEVLVRIHASSVKTDDLELLTGTIFVRPGGLRKPKYRVLGSDIAGSVEAVGNKVTQFQLDDEVFADLTLCGFGAFAEYVSVPESALALKPANLTFEDAAAVPSAAIIPLQGLRDKTRVGPGDRVLINGAGGGLGTFAVQIARSFGAEVTGVDSTEKLDMIRSIGADHVFDYTQEDFTRGDQRYDLILDLAVYQSFAEFRQIFGCKRVLSPGGRYVSLIVGGLTVRIFRALFLKPWMSIAGSRKMDVQLGEPNRMEDLLFVKGLLESSKITPVIDRTYPLSEVPEALRHLQSGRAQGKIVIVV